MPDCGNWIDHVVDASAPGALDAREKHLERFYKRLCHAEAGPVFIEMLVNLERISDHCQNIAEYVAGIQSIASHRFRSTGPVTR